MDAAEASRETHREKSLRVSTYQANMADVLGRDNVQGTRRHDGPIMLFPSSDQRGICLFVPITKVRKHN